MSTTTYTGRHVLQWLNDDCRVDAQSSVSALKMYTAFVAWCTHNKYKPVSLQRFGQIMGARFKKQRKNSGMFYVGITLKAP